jgi:Tol biopolymer transport system component
MIGERVGQYHIVDKIGSGGMGVVWKARDENLGRFVALKFLTNIDVPSRDRFKREARAASALNHPGIVTIHDILEHNGQPCIVMEYIEGRPLNEAIPVGGMPAVEVIRMGAQIAEALNVAHHAGIIHRDLKPSNVIINQDGRLKLLDFGLAKQAEATAGDDSTMTSSGGGSQPGMILGSVHYMSPEQAQGLPVDTRSDIFSLGAVLYEMATGRKAFAGDTMISTIMAIVRDEPMPINQDKAVMPHELERVVKQCLRKDPGRRVQTALDVRNTLEELGEAVARGSMRTQVIAVQQPKPRKRQLWALAGGLVAIGVGAWFFTPKPKRINPAAAPLIVRPLGNLPGRKQLPIFSNDGNAVIFAWDGGHEGRNSDIYMMQLEGGNPLQIKTHASSEWPQCFSPDGRRLYFNRQSESGYSSYWMPALGGDETLVTDGIVTDISPDGRSAVLVRLSSAAKDQLGIFVLNLMTGSERKVGENFGTTNPRFSADGKWVFVPNGPDRDHLSLHRVPVGGGKLEKVQWSSLGDDVERVEAVEFSPRRNRMRIAARQKATNVLISFIADPDGSNPKRLPASIGAGSLSPDGRQMVCVRNVFGVPIYRAAAFPARGLPVPPQKVFETPGEEYAPRFSPDGRHILVASYRSGHWGIWLWNAAMTDGRPVFSREGGTAGSPTWSPDGKWIAFDARTRSAAGDIWIMPVDGQPRVLVDRPVENITPCFDPTSQWVYFTSTRTGSLQIFRVPIAGGPVTQVTKGGGFRCHFSEDGRYIYYLKSRAGGEIWRLELATNVEEPVVPEMKSSNWQVLRDGIYMIDSGANSQFGTAARMGDARFYRFATKSIEDLGFRTPKPAALIGIDLSPDRKWVYYSQVDISTSELYLVDNLP